MTEKLSKATWFKGRRGPVVLVIMDGVGFGKYPEGDAVASAKKPTLDWLLATCPNTRLKAHGQAVGLPSDADMGNSEVGHNVIGCGRVFDQGAKLVSASIASGKMFEGQAWKDVSGNAVAKNSTLHFLGLFSDGNVHSHLDHLRAMIKRAAQDGVKKIRVHILLDGRDVGETSALEYVDPFEEFLAGVRDGGCDARIASGGGRMHITMDRYGANWGMVERGWKTHVHGEGRQFASAREAIVTLRKETKAIDQDLGAFVIAEQGKPVGTIEDGDSVVFFNFRGDRALEITAAFEEDDFTKFDRGRRPQVVYAGMMEYDGDLNVPKRFLTSPPAIDRISGEFLCAMGVRTLACSETQKYGHVTYFYNGNRSGKINAALEDYVEVPSDIVPFEQRPWMKGAEITDVVVEGILSGKYDFIRCNFPNGDMVGHTGVYQAAEIGIECVDLCLGRICRAVEKTGGVLVVTADHGNADDMYEHKKDGSVVIEDGVKKVKTAHSLNPVPCIIYDPESQGEYKQELRSGLGISAIAATCMNLLGYEAPADYDPGVLEH
ncbi:MAG: 2,3-bisphosphoglycerate-independent phosphoglycerate mutase [Lentisphaerae bacterium]|jgi:2,3-bisphosphoglycerate-independent phosphoglycerate mutase|nr:2,3-bisphosphoglycerate-independent phosphoglycerate mutase [Lentisphaerota bacterium]